MDFSIWSVSTPGRWLVSTPGRKQYLDTEIRVASSVANLDFLQFVRASLLLKLKSIKFRHAGIVKFEGTKILDLCSLGST